MSDTRWSDEAQEAYERYLEATKESATAQAKAQRLYAEFEVIRDHTPRREY